MTTLTEVRCNRKREKSFAGKPRPVRSGIALSRVHPVAHRSEVLLDDQMSLVTQTQDELEQAMVCLNSARGEIEVKKWRSKVIDLKAKCDEMILILSVVSKLKSELTYAKLELDKVNRSGSDIREARKRVVMLEDRMENLLSKYRKTPRKVLEEMVEGKESQGSVVARVNGDQPQVTCQELHNQSVITSTLHPFSTMEKKAKENEYAHEEKRGGGEGDKIDCVGPLQSIPKQAGVSSKGEGDGKVILEKQSEMRLSFEQVSPADSRKILDIGSVSVAHEMKESAGNHEEWAKEGGVCQPESNVFLTEGSLSALDVSFDQSFSPPNQDEADEENERDLASEYWMSPHHRFEYSEQRDVITRENPLSYHNLGLAVQSSFIEPAPSDMEDLPWCPRKPSSELPDVHLEGLPYEAHMHDFKSSSKKIALDKLSERIHKIWNKMEDATRKSLDCNTSHNSEQKGSVIRQVESRLSEESAGSLLRSDSQRASSGHYSPSKGLSRCITAPGPAPEDIAVPKGERVNVRGPMMVYHPRPVPEPDMLPLTRTNPSKKYPRISSDWNELLQESMEPTIRLVNQMNVAKETNLLVYKTKDKKRRNLSISSNARKQTDTARRRWMLASNPVVKVAAAVAHVNTRKRLSTIKLNKESLKWKRIQDILGNLKSERVEERRDAAMHLGSLDCNERDVLAALVEVVQNDKDSRVCYEAAKSLVSLGFWSDHSLKVIVKHMQEGNSDIRSDLVKTLINSRNIQMANKKSPCIKQLIHILREICGSSEPSDLGFDCAVCLGCLGVADPNAKEKLKGSLSSKDTNVTARSLEILVRYLDARELDVINMVLHQMQFSKAWKHRVAAAKLLVIIGLKQLKTEEDFQRVLHILENRLYDDPSREVRSEIASTLASLELKDLVVDLTEKRLEDDDDENRAHAVIAVGVLGMKSDKVVRSLLEMLELDSCDYVRLQIIRTFGCLGLTNMKIIRALKERERSEGPLAREATNSLRILNDLKITHGSRSTTRTPDKPRKALKS